MTDSSTTLRTLLVYALVLPLALVVGYMLATPTDFSTWAMVGLVLLLLAMPLLLKWHHPFLFLTWNMTAVVFFLPGRPQFWLVTAFVSLTISLVQRTLLRDMRFLHAPSVELPLLFLAAVVVMTGRVSGGIGLRIFGSQTIGAKNYLFILAAIVGFFAMMARQIPPHKVLLYLGLFFLGSIANAIGSTIDLVSPSLYYIFWLFPIDYLPGRNPGEVMRYGGLGTATIAIFWYLLARYGLKDMLSGRGLWRLLLLMVSMAVTMGGGFRSFFIVMAIGLLLVIYLEGLFRSSEGVLFIAGAVIACALVIPLADKLPLSIQRTLSFLPIHVDPVALSDAESSSEWRVKIWKTILPEVPKYFWLGRGLGISAAELDATQATAQVVQRAGGKVEEDATLMVGNFHNGPLTVIIFFGIWGVVGWLWFIIASIRALCFNYLYGDEALKKINRLLLAYFVANTISFHAVSGDMRTQLATFTGIIAVSLCFNGGIRKPVRVPVPAAKSIPIKVRRPTRPMPGLSR